MDSNNIQKELKLIAKREATLVKKREKLLAMQKEQKKNRDKIALLYKQSGFKSPQELVAALCDAFQIKGYGKPVKRKSTVKPGKKHKGRVDAQLVKAVKDALNSGMNRNQAALKFGISYPTVTKIKDGSYDKIS